MNLDLSKLKRYSIFSRKSKVKREKFAKVCGKGGSFAEFYGSLPDLLKARDFKAAAAAVVEAAANNKPVIFMMGAHIIKCGLSPLIIELINRGIITCVALNGAGIIHDFELAYAGRTSEDVAEAIEDGSFGMAQETQDILNQAISEGVGAGLGLGEAVGKMINRENLENKGDSILWTAFKKKIPVTVHVGIGTDIIHQGPNCDGAAIGEGSLRDFRLLIQEVMKLGDGGVCMNIGSAVILPEVFLKAVTSARNLGAKVKNFTTCVFDQIYHYRPSENVMKRPVSLGGKGYYIVGHHEIMIPLFVRAVIELLSS